MSTPNNQPEPVKPHTRAFIEAVLHECLEKHQLHPLESDVNGDYHVELTFTVQEIRNLLIENGNCWDAQKHFEEHFAEGEEA